MTSTGWCCAAFEGHFQLAGMRGFAVFTVTGDDGNPAFILQRRAIGPGAPYPISEEPASVVSDVQIQFCPWCGVRLQKQFQNQIQDLDRSDLRVSF